MKTEKPSQLFHRVREILDAARAGVARSVNTTQVVANWLIGREIFEEEQKGKRRADYGEQLLEELAAQLKTEFGSGYSHQNLRYIRQLFVSYPALLINDQICHALRGKSPVCAPDPGRAHLKRNRAGATVKWI